MIVYLSIIHYLQRIVTLVALIATKTARPQIVSFPTCEESALTCARSADPGTTERRAIQYRTRISSPLMRAFASHRIASHAGKCAHVRAFASHARNARICAHSHRMREKCAHSHRMRGNARIRIACAEMRALRRERRVNEIAGMTPAQVFWCQTPETGFVVVRCIHKYWG